MRARTIQPFSLCLCVVAACGGSPADPAGPDAGGGGIDAAPLPGDFTSLISGEWQLAPGDEDYFCARLTVTEDIHVTAFRAVSPPGTHHSVLTVGEPDGPDGVTRCNAGTNHDAMIYGAGIGTNAIALPAGVAMPVRAGQQLLLNLHLFNASEQPLAGTSAVEVAVVSPDEVENEAEVILMGKTFTLLVPPGESTQVGTCTMNGDVTLFMVSPHMHRLGTRMQLVAERAGQDDLVLHDAPYSFEDQQIYPIQPVEMKRIHCTYDNPTGQTVPFGDSSNQEMCFGTTYRYPAFGGTFGIVCAQD
jgi:hypothetical protein